jgi:drug/metabolite transporter (DMT)-like permease
MFSALFGLGLLIPVVLTRGQALPVNSTLFYSVIAGAAGALALVLLYRALATGSMAIVAPISATGALLPVLAGLATGDSPSNIQAFGMVVAIIGTVLASREKNNGSGENQLAAGIGLAVGAAVCVGVFFILLDRASETDPYWAAFIVRISQAVLLLSVVLCMRMPLRIGRIHLPALISLGCIDALATIAWAIATTKGLLSLVAVIGSLYPAVTVLLAVILLKERPQFLQAIGVILAIIGVVLISAG